MAMERLFGALAGSPDFHEAAGRADMRLGAWCWLADEAARMASPGSDGLDDQACLMTALLGLYYLGSGV